MQETATSFQERGGGVLWSVRLRLGADDQGTHTRARTLPPPLQPSSSRWRRHGGLSLRPSTAIRHLLHTIEVCLCTTQRITIANGPNDAPCCPRTGATRAAASRSRVCGSSGGRRRRAVVYGRAEVLNDTPEARATIEDVCTVRHTPITRRPRVSVILPASRAPSRARAPRATSSNASASAAVAAPQPLRRRQRAPPVRPMPVALFAKRYFPSASTISPIDFRIPLTSPFDLAM